LNISLIENIFGVFQIVVFEKLLHKVKTASIRQPFIWVWWKRLFI